MGVLLQKKERMMMRKGVDERLWGVYYAWVELIKSVRKVKESAGLLRHSEEACVREGGFDVRLRGMIVARKKDFFEILGGIGK